MAEEQGLFERKTAPATEPAPGAGAIEPSAPPINLFKKLAAVMKAVSEPVEKEGFNAFHRYHYVMETTLVAAIRSELCKAGVLILTSIIRHQTMPCGDKKDQELTIIETSHTFIDSDSGESYSVTMMGYGADKGDKGLYKAITGANKYMLLKTFQIPTGDDPEGDEKTDKAAYGKPEPAQMPQRKAVEAPKPAPAANMAASGRKISEAQGKRLYAIARGQGWQDGELRSLLKGYGIEHSRDIPVEKYDEIVRKVEAGQMHDDEGPY